MKMKENSQTYKCAYIHAHLRAHPYTYIQLHTQTQNAHNMYTTTSIRFLYKYYSITYLTNMYTTTSITQCVYLLETGHTVINVSMHFM